MPVGMSAVVDYAPEAESWIVSIYSNHRVVASDATPAQYHGKPGVTGASHSVADWVHRKYCNVDEVLFPELGMTINRNVQPVDWTDTSRTLQISNDDRRSLDAYIRFQQSEPCWDEKCSARWMGKSDKVWDSDSFHYFSSAA